MKLNKESSKITLSRSEWEEIGKTAGWLQEEMTDVLGGDVEEYKSEFEKPTYPMYPELLRNYGTDDILWAIKSLGEESIAGFSNVREDEVKEVLSTCEPYELGEIKNWLRKHRGEGKHKEIK